MARPNVSRKKWRLLSVAAGLLPFSPALAQTEPAEEGEAKRPRNAAEIVITAGMLSSPDVPLATPVQVLSGDKLAHRRQGGLGETLAGLPGVHLDNFGGGASRPVIRGQTVPRIEILSDGANLFDVSSISPDHAISTDPLLLDGIEVLRGPGATRYGGNAANGAINLIDSKVPKALPQGGLSGATEVRFGTGDEEKTVVGRVTAGLGPFAIHAQGSRRRSDDYEVPDAFSSDKLRDSFADSSSYSFGASWITSNGYFGASYTRQDSEYGLPGHSHEGAVCHSHGLDLHCEAHGQWTDPSLGWDDGHTAFIKLRSERIDARGDYYDLLPGIANARLRLSYTDYEHDEIDGAILFSEYANRAYDARVELTHVPIFGFSGMLGIQYTHSTFTGLDRIDPEDAREFNEYITENLAIFLSERRSFGRFDLEVSARKDWRTIDIPYNLHADLSEERLAFLERVLGPDRFSAELERRRLLWREIWNPASEAEPFSAAVSGTWNFDAGYSVALSLSRSERAPSLRELYASGPNLATNSLEFGLLPAGGFGGQFPEFTGNDETTRAINLTFRKAAGATNLEIGLFYQDVDNYVFAQFVDEDTLDSGAPFRYLVYTPADVSFTGIDGQVSHQFAPSSRLTLFGDYVRAKMKDEDDNLPRIPPGRLGARYEGQWGALSVDLEYHRTFGQERVASYETTTAGYNMVNATVAYRFDIGSGEAIELYATGTNLLDELAFSHSSFVKHQSPLRGRNVVIGMRHLF